MKTLREEAEELATLDNALRWARAREPKLTPLETIPQDEYTHDVIFRAEVSQYLVFDAT